MVIKIKRTELVCMVLVHNVEEINRIDSFQSEFITHGVEFGQLQSGKENAVSACNVSGFEVDE